MDRAAMDLFSELPDELVDCTVDIKLIVMNNTIENTASRH
jgi:hypothetical protein